MTHLAQKLIKAQDLDTISEFIFQRAIVDKKVFFVSTWHVHCFSSFLLLAEIAQLYDLHTQTAYTNWKVIEWKQVFEWKQKFWLKLNFLGVPSPFRLLKTNSVCPKQKTYLFWCYALNLYRGQVTCRFKWK